VRSTPVGSKQRAKASAEEMKTAAMLFVVTFVFALTFLPTLAISSGLIPYHPVVFYMYFFNFVANPIIYSFMSESLRKQLKDLFDKSAKQ
jgi:cholecystokinin A receptor